MTQDTNLLGPTHRGKLGQIVDDCECDPDLSCVHRTAGPRNAKPDDWLLIRYDQRRKDGTSWTVVVQADQVGRIVFIDEPIIEEDPL